MFYVAFSDILKFKWFSSVLQNMKNALETFVSTLVAFHDI